MWSNRFPSCLTGSVFWTITTCAVCSISKRTLQRYRTSGELPYEMIYHKTFYRESDVLRFIERNFSNFRKLKKDRPAGSG